MKHFLLLITLTTTLLTSCDPPPAGPLTIGDKLPLLKVPVNINSTTKEAVLVAPKDKLIILEFISTWCGTCRKSIPHLEKLQRSFPDQLQVILVTQQQDSLVKRVVEENHWSLPIITEDSALSKLFPHLTVPHQVWIKDRKVLAITGWQYANQQNVVAALAGEELKTYFKKEDTIDITRPLITGEIKPYYQSVITPRINYGSGIRKTANQLLIYNADIPGLYQYAYDMPAFPKDAYVHLEVSDSLRQLITGPNNQLTGIYEQDSAYLSWRDKYLFCYNVNYPPDASISQSQYRTAMQQDLNRFFHTYLGITAAVEKRQVKCLTLVRTNDRQTYAGRDEISAASTNSNDYKITNKPLQLLINQISYRHHDLGIPVVNATGVEGNVSLKIEGGLGDLEKVNQGLEKYGLQFTEKICELDLVVIKETDSTNL